MNALITDAANLDLQAWQGSSEFNRSITTFCVTVVLLRLGRIQKESVALCWLWRTTAEGVPLGGAIHGRCLVVEHHCRIRPSLDLDAATYL